MKAIRTKNRIKALAVSIAVCLAIVVGMVFSFGYGGGKTVSAADGDDDRTSETGIRFVQVAAGEKFAIGLTYDNRLFGWSLTGNTQSSTAATADLGDYYTITPTEIKVTYKNGPNGASRWDWTDNRGSYHGVKQSDDKIVSIAATRTTAAFVTEAGYIYTWGKDSEKDLGGNAYSGHSVQAANSVADYHYLLLRPTSDTNVPEVNWYTPYIIDYNYYVNNSAGSTGDSGLYHMVPTGTLSRMSIAGGENNYIISLYANSIYSTYVWGSLMYAPVLTDGFTYDDGVYDFSDGATNTLFNVVDSRIFRRIYKTQYGSAYDYVTAVAGGYTVGLNASAVPTGTGQSNVTSLTLKGKNFVTAAGIQVNGNTLTPALTVNANTHEYLFENISMTERQSASGLSDAYFDGHTIKNAIVGGNYSLVPESENSGVVNAAPDGDSDSGTKADLYFARQATASSGTKNILYAVPSSSRLEGNKSGIKNSKGEDLESYVKGSANVDATPIILNAVSLGNDIGYGISSEGELYAWGDNTQGQSGLGSGTSNYGYPEKTLTSQRFKTVAAGKQTSPDKDKKALNSSDTFNSDYTAFSEDVQNGKKYITGAITTEGALYVWSDKHMTPQNILFNNNVNTKFAAVYSGYERNIFAVTEYGKLVHITCDDSGNFSQKVHDYFMCLDGTTTKAMTNWTVDSGNKQNSAGKSSVRFKIPEQPTTENLDPSIGKITLYVDNAVADKTSVEINGTAARVDEEMPYGGKARKSLVSSNASGDAFRILSPTNNDYQIVYASVTTSGTSTTPDQPAAQAPSLSKDDLTPKFSFRAKGTTTFVDMTEKDQWSQMFTYQIVGEGSDIGIEITPKRSTQNGTVNVSFYVARFDNIDAPATANYYDYLQCNVEFTIDNSDVVRVYDSYGASGDRSAIPLLDPNNDSNRYYSLAVQNVSTGFTKLADFLTKGDSQAATKSAALVSRIKEYLNESKTGDVATQTTLNWDPGFPDINKVTAGNLKYYLGNNVETDWYTDSYNYLFADRDLDVVRLTNITSDNTRISGVTSKHKTVNVSLTGLASDDDNKILINYDSTLQDRINKLFENVYGLVGITVTPGTDENESYVDAITFSYQILLFTAVGSTSTTGSELNYGDTPAVTSFKTTEANAQLTFTLDYEEYVRFNADFTTMFSGGDFDGYEDKNVPGREWGGAVSAFAEPSVRLRSAYKEGNEIVYGAMQSGSGYTANNHLEIVDQTEYTVGGNDIVIPLSRYIATPGDNVTFSFKNKNDSFAGFNDQFKDSVVNENYVTLTRNQITVRLLGAHPIYFTVTIQRFFTPQSEENENNYFDNGDETVTISFTITTVRAVSFTESSSSTQQNRTFNISREMYFYVFGIESAPEAERANVVNSTSLVSLSSAYTNVMTMTKPMSSNGGVLEVAKVSNSVIKLTPGESGKSVVQFTLSVYGTDIPIKLTFNVAGKTTIKDKDSGGNEINYTVNLADVQYVYLSTLTTGLSNAVGDFMDDVGDYVVLYDDKVEKDGRNIYEGVDFVLDGAEYDEGSLNSEKSANDYYAKFVQNIAFYETGTERAYMRIDINSDATFDQLKGEYIIYVKFVDKKENYHNYAEAAGGTILKAAFRLKANKQVAFVDGAMLEIVADVDHPKKANENDTSSTWYMTGENTEAKIYVPLRYLCGLVGIQNYNEYEIFLVSMPEGAAKKINTVGGSDSTLTELEITPLYNTKSPITINVSIRNKTKGQSENQVIAFSVSVKGISTVLSKADYTQIWLVAFFSSLGLLMLIFLIRMIIYWRRRAKQRALIKRNQELIKMRDKVHNKATTATREQAIKTKLKLQDPKYAKMFNEMKKDQNGGIGVSTVGEDGVPTDDKKSKKKKKGGKKSMAELKAELAAKKAAFAQAQAGGDPFGGQNSGFGAPGPDFGTPGPDFGAPGPEFGAPGGDFGSPTDMYSPSDLDGNAIIFDAPDIDGQA